MAFIYLLYHTYILEDCDETKFIGAYSTEEFAIKAKERTSLLPGFKQYPDAFEIVKQKVDEDEWKEGFATMTTLEIINNIGEKIVVQAEVIAENQFVIIEYYNEDKILPFKNGDIVIETESHGVQLVTKN